MIIDESHTYFWSYKIGDYKHLPSNETKEFHSQEEWNQTLLDVINDLNTNVIFRKALNQANIVIFPAGYEYIYNTLKIAKPKLNLQAPKIDNCKFHGVLNNGMCVYVADWPYKSNITNIIVGFFNENGTKFVYKTNNPLELEIQLDPKVKNTIEHKQEIEVVGKE
jgi:hypothetical protein